MALDSFFVLSRVVSAALLSLLERQKKRTIRAAESPPHGAAVFVMLPLDAFSPSCPVDLSTALPRLAAAGVRGIMVDVWWGICEPAPGSYEFSRYKEIAEMCRSVGLRMQATVSLHACGGNVGDTVNVPLPAWVLEAGDEYGMWYMDRAGFCHRECLSLSADNVSFLPTKPKKPLASKPGNPEIASSNGLPTPALEKSGGEGQPKTADVSQSGAERESSEEVTGIQSDPVLKTVESDVEATEPDHKRTALQAYKEFIVAFLTAMGPDMIGTTIVELQVGCGPCGELRYPSYPLGTGMWEFPGMGEFQCFDKGMLGDLASRAGDAGLPVEWGEPPSDTGSYNAQPNSCSFFRDGFASARGSFFLTWYAEALLTHGDNMMQIAADAIEGHSGITLALKISGIHWWKFTRSRAAEATAGYYSSNQYQCYERIAAMLSKYGAVLDFTCLEMRTWDQPFLKARCGPRQLVREVFQAAEGARVRVAGENALERYDKRAYDQIAKAYRSVDPDLVYGFTFLRLGATLLKDENFRLFEKFVSQMQRIGS